MVESRAASLYWAGVFGKAAQAATAPAAMGRVGRNARYDWSGVFRETQLVSEARGEARMPRLDVASVRPLAVVYAAAPGAAPAAGDYAAPAVDASAALAAAPIVRNAGRSPYNPMARVFGGHTREVRPSTEDLISVSADSATLSQPAVVVPRTVGPRPFSGDMPMAAGDRAIAGAVSIAPPVVALDKAAWELINTVNRNVNRRIRRSSDARTFGVADFWQAPTEPGARGDCEDYVLAKRADLLRAGIPAGALSIAIVNTRWGESHAVLLLSSNVGEVVLDNLSPWISRWDQVDYDWQERQAPGRIFDWVRMAS